MAILERHIKTINLQDSANSTTIPVLMTTGIVYTKTVDIEDASYVAVTLTGGTQTATGSGKMKVEVEQGYTVPAVEGSASPHFIVTDTVLTTANTWLTAGITSMGTVTLKGLRYMRLKATPVTPNTSANFTGVVSMQVGG